MGTPSRLVRWLQWRWHLIRYRNRDATWHAVHSYGCRACDWYDS